MAEKRDFYDVLGVEKTADDAAIKKAYRRLAMTYHPDRNPGDSDAEEKFKELAEAYAALSDPEKRALYDQFGHQGLGASAGVDPNDIFSSFGDVFADLFGGGRSRNPNAPARGNDLEMRLRVPFEFAVHGGVRVVSVQQTKACGRCKGSAAEPGSSPEKCGTCGGAGRVRMSQGLFTVQTACPTCRGRGKTINEPCNECRGQGAVRQENKVTVKVPPGVQSGNRMRYRSEGDPGHNGGPAGDLYVLLEVEASDVFERDGADLHLAMPIRYAQACLGSAVTIPTLDDEERVKIKAGTQHGDTRTLRGHGLPMIGRRGGRGDLYVHFQIDVPTKVKGREKELLEELEELHGDKGGQDSSLWDRIKSAWKAPKEEPNTDETEESEET
ncbi:MAG: molecular chaperone DnaJ [Bradymonadia bacterium]|jgi:molecular chaperone DnaJ